MFIRDLLMRRGWWLPSGFRRKRPIFFLLDALRAYSRYGRLSLERNSEIAQVCLGYILLIAWWRLYIFRVLRSQSQRSSNYNSMKCCQSSLTARFWGSLANIVLCVPFIIALGNSPSWPWASATNTLASWFTDHIYFGPIVNSQHSGSCWQIEKTIYFKK